MKRHKRHRLWIVGVVTLALVSFLVGTSLACLQKSVGTVQMAEDCCQRHCQHAMSGDVATDCCQSHQVDVSQALPFSPPAKILLLANTTVLVAVIPLAVSQGPGRLRLQEHTGESPPPESPFYTLYCSLLI